jgi:N-ethylmaleimide reductase
MAPLTRNRAPGAVPGDDGRVLPPARRPWRGAGLIVSEGTAISPQGQGYADVPGLYDSAQLDGWQQVTKAVHAAGGRIFCQLWHVGRVSHPLLQPGHQPPVAPSAIRANTKTYVIDGEGQGGFTPTSEPRALHRHEIPLLVHDFAAAARNAVQSAGFDGVEIHGANGYLLDQFLKTGANRREDDYGGAIANRARLMLEVARAVADAVGAERTGLRVSPVTPANDIVDADPQPLFQHLMRELAPLPLAYVHVIEGATGGARGRRPPLRLRRHEGRLPPGRRPGRVDGQQRLRRRAGRAAIESGHADLVAFGKPFISMPDWTERLRRNLPAVAPERATLYGGGAHGYIDYPPLED